MILNTARATDRRDMLKGTNLEVMKVSGDLKLGNTSKSMDNYYLSLAFSISRFSFWSSIKK